MAEKSSQARYEEIAAYLRGLLAGREPGDRLPSEAELCERFSVSRMTARHAMQILAAEGLLYRRRGRGTFASPHPATRLLGSPLSFSVSAQRRGLRPSSQVIAAAVRDPEPADVEALGLGPGEQVVVVERLRLADGVPMAIERAVLVPACAAILDDDLEQGSLHAAVERLGRIPTRAQAQVTARAATGRERHLLELGAAGVVLCERRVITDQDATPIEHTETRYAAERYVFEAVFHRNGTDLME